MANPELCTEAEVQHLVHAFYAKVRADELLAPIFDAHVVNWEQHLAQLVDFWSSALRGTARFRGNPLATQALGNTALQMRADELAHRIAGSLWHGYQGRHGSEPAPLSTNHG